ncbi:MAG: hypothetical protein ACRC8U_04555 [Brooklawnia sp.]
MPTSSDVFDPAQLDVCDRWKVRIAPLIESLGGVQPTLLQAGAMLLNMAETKARTKQGVAWLIATTAHLLDERAFLADLKELHAGSQIVRDVVSIDTDASDTDLEAPLIIIPPSATPDRWLHLELTDGEQIIVLGKWGVIELVGPDVGEAFVQVPNSRGVMYVERGNVSTTLDGRTWTGTNPLKEPA